MDVDGLLAEEETAWRELHAAFAAIATEQLEEPGITPDGWSPKDVMFHIGAWAAECAHMLECIRMGTFEDPFTTGEAVNRQNREWFEQSRTMDPGTVRAEFIAARTRMLQEWAALPTVTPEAWEWLEESGPIHYRKHLEDLAVWTTK